MIPPPHPHPTPTPPPPNMIPPPHPLPKCPLNLQMIDLSKRFALKLSNHTEWNQHTQPCPNNHSYGLWEVKKIRRESWLVNCMENLDRVNFSIRRVDAQRLPSPKWTPAMGNGRWFLPHFCYTPFIRSNLSLHWSSKPHKVKGYADDITIILSTPAEHQEVMIMMDDRCMDVGLGVRSGKCYSTSHN